MWAGCRDGWSILLITMPPTTSFPVQVLGLDHKIGSFEVRHGRPGVSATRANAL